MKELEEVNCEIRRVVDFQLSVSDRLNSLENENVPVNQQEQKYNTLCGGFLNDATYAWLSYGSHLVVINVRTGENASSWTFKERISSVCQFPAQPGTLPLLLVGLDNGAVKVKDSVGWVCVFDCTTSRVLRAIRMPTGVEQVCVVSGGAEWEEFNDKRPDNILSEMEGIACAALRNLHHVMIDLQRPVWESANSSVIMDESSPAEIEFVMSKDSIIRTINSKRKHAAYNLLNSRIERHIGFNREEFESTAFLEESLTSVLISSMKIGCLISGCLGRVIMWQNDGSVGWISLPVDETMIVTHLALLEPMDDPRPFYYLWVVHQDETLKSPPLLRMYALLFERKYCDRGTNLYFNLEAEPSLKFEFELDAKDKVISLSSIERGTNPDQTESGTKRDEDNLLLITTSERTLLFDLNQWYKEQMPQTISECQNPNSILACYQTQPNSHNAKDNQTISSTYVPYTLREFPNNSPNSPEELFYPNSLSLEWIELTSTKLLFWLSRGIQAELLRQMAIAGPIILTQPSETFHKCLSVGLVPYNSEFTFTSDQNAQREMLLSLCLEQRWATFLVRCAKEWWDGSAAYLYPIFLKWGVQRASSIKMIADRLCVPLFDQSGSNIGETEVKTLRFCSQQLECLSNVVAKLPFETSDLTKQCRVLKRVSTYLQVLLWFYDVGLLPESQDLEEGPLPISLALKVPYPFEKLFALYKEKRSSIHTGKEHGEVSESLFIDELIAKECSVLKPQWEREAGDIGGNGYYPPPSLQSLLRSYLTDCNQTELNEIECKHQITIYLLMDLAMLLQGSYPGVDQLVKYPSAFKMSPSLIRLTQAFWLLDHEDYQGFLDMMTGQLVSDSDVKDWHHQLALRTLVRNNQHKLALTYLRIRKPPLSSVEDQSTLISLSVEYGLVQSAFHRRPQSHYTQLLLCFFQACKAHGKLGDILHLALDFDEEEVFVKFLEENNANDLRLLYYLQRCRYTEANNGNLISQYSTKNDQATSFTMLNAYNATLPDVIKRFSLSMAKTNLDVDLESRYPRPMSHYKSCHKTASIYETVMKKAKETFLRGEKFQIPFISAPCVSLKLDDNHANINCVLFPKRAQKDHGKRTVDEIYDEEENGIKTSDGAKRRKISDDNDSSTEPSKGMTLNVAFNTPLVKRKVNVSTNRETPVETPHSILKIRQMIRNSNSPSAGTSQIDAAEGALVDKEKKISRQIRFSINQSNKDISQEEVSEEEDTGRANMSVESEEAFYSPNISVKSFTESAVLSNSSCSNKNIYTPRPRPSLRRICMQTPKETNETLEETPGTTYAATPSRVVPTTINTRSASKLLSKLKPDNSVLSTSIYTPPVLSRDSSFEMSRSLRLSEQSSLQKQTSYNYATASTPLVRNAKNNMDDVEEMDVVDEELLLDLSCVQKLPENHEGSLRKTSHSLGGEDEELKESKKSESAYKNGDVMKNQNLHQQSGDEEDAEIDIEHVDASEDEENDVAFESLSNITNESLEEQRKDRLSWSPSNIAENVQNTNIDEQSELGNGENFDITDDESSDEIALIYEESQTEAKRSSSTPPEETDNLYDASNITEDESDSSIDIGKSDTRTSGSRGKLKKSMEKKKDVNVSKVQTDLTKHFTSGINKRSKKLVGQAKLAESNAFSENSNPSPLTPAKDLASETESPTFNESMLDNSVLKDEGNVRVTRSRRASSIAKETIAALSSSPRSEKTRSARRASSLAKEVLTASIVASDDTKRVISSGSEDSGTSSPRNVRTRRAASLVTDAEITKANVVDETEVKVRRSTRRPASVQKELPEITKQLTQANRISSTSSLISEDGEEETEMEGKGKRNSARRIAAGTRTTRTTRTQTAKNKPEKSEVKSTRRRGSSEPKEITQEVRITRRSSSVAKEVIPEVLKASLEPVPEDTETVTGSSKRKTKEARSRRSGSVAKEVITEKFEISLEPITEGTSAAKETRRRRSNSVAKEVAETKEAVVESVRRRQSLSKDATNSPAVNTRSRKSSIQSIPEELEEILSVPSMERKAASVGKKSKNAQSGLRQRRASSVDLSEITTQKHTRSTRRKNILKETIAEEEPMENKEEEALNTKKVPTRRKRTTSEISSQETLSTRAQKTTAQELENQFSFSQPEDGGDPPLDQKAIGEVPNYIFSPPQTRSRNNFDQQRREITAKTVEGNQVEEEEEKEQVWRSLQARKSCTYRRVTINSNDPRFRTKFVVPKWLKNTTD